MRVTPFHKRPIAKFVRRVDKWNPVKDGDGQEFNYIDLSAVDSERKAINGYQQICANNAPSRARQIVKTGDVLVSTVRPNLNGVARVPRELDSATASTGFCVLRPDVRQLWPDYLYYWVQSPIFVSDMTRKATGQSYPAVSDRIVFESEIPLPPLPEQKRIAAILDQADALRRLRQRALARLGTLGQAIFYEMFGDPTTNPMGWPEDRVLGDVADVVSGITKGRKLRGQSTREVPYLAVANVQDRHLLLEPLKTIAATEHEIDRYRLQENDLLLTEGGDPDKLGRGTLWKNELPECIHQNHVFRVRLNTELVNPLFLNWLVGSQRGKQYFLRSAKQTTGIASINMKQLRGFPLIIPPQQLQEEFACHLGHVETSSANLSTARKRNEALFASLLQRAFRGEL